MTIHLIIGTRWVSPIAEPWAPCDSPCPFPYWQVYADKYARANSAGAALLADAQLLIAQSVNTAAPSQALSAIVVFNALSWARTDPAFGVAPPSTEPFGVFDSNFSPVQSQITANGSVLFIASVPSFGFSTYFMMPPKSSSSASREARYVSPGSPWISPFTNAFYTVAPGRGGIASWMDLSTGAELFDTRAYDVGEWMELQVSMSGVVRG